MAEIYNRWLVCSLILIFTFNINCTYSYIRIDSTRSTKITFTSLGTSETRRRYDIPSHHVISTRCTSHLTRGLRHTGIFGCLAVSEEPVRCLGHYVPKKLSIFTNTTCSLRPFEYEKHSVMPSVVFSLQCISCGRHCPWLSKSDRYNFDARYSPFRILWIWISERSRYQLLILKAVLSIWFVRWLVGV